MADTSVWITTTMYEYLTKLLEFLWPCKTRVGWYNNLYSIHGWSSKYIIRFKLSSVMFLGCWYVHITSYVQITTLTVFDYAGKYWAFLHLGHGVSENEDSTTNKHLWSNSSHGDIENSAGWGPEQLGIDDLCWERRLD